MRASVATKHISTLDETGKSGNLIWMGRDGSFRWYYLLPPLAPADGCSWWIIIDRPTVYGTMCSALHAQLHTMSTLRSRLTTAPHGLFCVAASLVCLPLKGVSYRFIVYFLHILFPSSLVSATSDVDLLYGSITLSIPTAEVLLDWAACSSKRASRMHVP